MDLTIKITVVKKQMGMGGSRKNNSANAQRNLIRTHQTSNSLSNFPLLHSILRISYSYSYAFMYNEWTLTLCRPYNSLQSFNSKIRGINYAQKRLIPAKIDWNWFMKIAEFRGIFLSKFHSWTVVELRKTIRVHLLRYLPAVGWVFFDKIRN